MDFWSAISREPGFLPSVAAILAVLAFYVVAWYLVGRDPKPRSTTPEYEPPRHLSPPALRYLRNGAFDHKVLVSAVLDIAARGCAKISNEYGAFVLTMTRPLEGLPREEQAFAGRILKDGWIDFSEHNAEHIRSCAKTLQDSIRDQVENRYLNTHTEYFIAGVTISILALLQVFSHTPGGQSLISSLLLALVAGMLATAMGKVQEQRNRPQEQSTGAFLAPSIMFGLFFFAGAARYNFMRFFWPIIATLVLILINVLFQWLLQAPTREGRQVLDDLEGFREFLAAVELEKFRTLYPSRTIPDTVDSFFPYAFALDLEHEWTDRFSSAVKSAMVLPTETRTNGFDVFGGMAIVAASALGAQARSRSAG